jgi:hypothetical protein
MSLHFKTEHGTKIVNLQGAEGHVSMKGVLEGSQVTLHWHDPKGHVQRIKVETEVTGKKVFVFELHHHEHHHPHGDHPHEHVHSHLHVHEHLHQHVHEEHEHTEHEHEEEEPEHEGLAEFLHEAETLEHHTTEAEEELLHHPSERLLHRYRHALEHELRYILEHEHVWAHTEHEQHMRERIRFLQQRLQIVQWIEDLLHQLSAHHPTDAATDGGEQVADSVENDDGSGDMFSAIPASLLVATSLVQLQKNLHLWNVDRKTNEAMKRITPETGIASKLKKAWSWLKKKFS